MLYLFESDVRLLNGLSKHGFTHAPDRGVTSMQAVARLRKLVRQSECHVCECGDVTNRDVARFRCVDVNAVLEAESFANVNVNVYRSPPIANESPWPEPRSFTSG